MNKKNDRYFTVTVYGIDLPGVLDEPFPERVATDKRKFFMGRLKRLFGRK